MASRHKQRVWTGDERYFWPRANILAAARRPNGEAIRGQSARWRPVWQSYSLLKHHPQAYRVHTGEQIKNLAECLRMIGCVKAVVCAREETVLCGWGVVLAARYLEMEQLPVLALPIEPDSLAALTLLFLDNELPRLAWADAEPRAALLSTAALFDPLEGGTWLCLDEDEQE